MGSIPFRNKKLPLLPRSLLSALSPKGSACHNRFLPAFIYLQSNSVEIDVPADVWLGGNFRYLVVMSEYYIDRGNKLGHPLWGTHNEMNGSDEQE